MKGILLTFTVSLLAVVRAAPAATHTIFPTPQQQQKYLIDFADEPSYFNNVLQKQDYQSSPSQYQASPAQYQPSPTQYQANPAQYQGNTNQYQQQQPQGGAPSRLETFEDPNNQVELIQPQQTPQQQNPAAPNVPGIAPGQRVYIIHMPVPGYRPGTIGGYQPVYVVAAAPNGNPNNQGTVPGYQNTVYQDASVIPVIGGGRFGFAGVPQQGAFNQQGFNRVQPQQGFLIGGVGPQGSPGLLVGGSPYNVYQEPLVYQPVAVQVPQGSSGSVRLNQHVALQTPPSNTAGQQSAQIQQQKAESKQSDGSEVEESKESAELPRRAPRPAPPAASVRAKP